MQSATQQRAERSLCDVTSPNLRCHRIPHWRDIAGLTLAQYLARLAAEATTIINAVDYGPPYTTWQRVGCSY